jgi:hypothetical protein
MTPAAEKNLRPYPPKTGQKIVSHTLTPKGQSINQHKNWFWLIWEGSYAIIFFDYLKLFCREGNQCSFLTGNKFVVQKLWGIFDFNSSLGMLSATTNVAKSAQIYPKVPKSVEICPKIISLRNFEIPPKFEILLFFKKKILYVEEALRYVLNVW